MRVTTIFGQCLERQIGEIYMELSAIDMKPGRCSRTIEIVANFSTVSLSKFNNLKNVKHCISLAING